ncbi:MIP family channel protein [Nocardioides panacisoli]|uniref:MIP family channel protein n=1 Tax=Nocardioides panacisoli TaxID=627624 RepID=A0ABP7IG35_9ACTN
MTEVAADATPVAPPTTAQKLAAELIGTFVLVFIGCGAAVYTGVDIVATGLAFGLAIVMMAYAFGRVSGGHFNPAVSLGAALAGRIPWLEAALYAAAQVVGGLVGALALWIVLHGFDGYKSSVDGIGANSFGDTNGNGFAWWAAFLLELVLTAVFVMVILAVTDERNDTTAFAPLVIGLTLSAIHFVAIPATGTSVNPARSIGPGIFTFDGDHILQLWLFILAPLVGAVVSGFVYPLVFGRGKEPVAGSGLAFRAAQPAVAVPGLGAPNAFEQQWNQQAYAQQAPEQPIIQDGWQWDPATQQWIPAQQQPAVPPQPSAQGWAPPVQADPGDPSGQTQVRPPQ